MSKGKNKFLSTDSPAGILIQGEYNINLKHYAKVNRDGTIIRIKSSHKQLASHLTKRFDKGMFLRRMTDEMVDEVEILSKEDWKSLASELKLGLSDNFISITADGNFAGLIIACEEIKKDINSAGEFVERVRELKEQKEKEVAETIKTETDDTL